MAETDDGSLRETLENRLMGQGLYVTAWDREDDVVDLEYEVVDASSTVTSEEVGTVCRTLVTVADERPDWSPVTVHATSTTTDGVVRGTWRVEADWLRRLGDELTEVAFSRRVLDSIDVDSEDG